MIDIGPEYFHVYFNRHQAEPLVWCVSHALGNWEIAVKHVLFQVPCETRHELRRNHDGFVVPSSESGVPSAYISAYGRLKVDAKGNARISAADEAVCVSNE